MKYCNEQQHFYQVFVVRLILTVKTRVHLTSHNPCEQEWNINTSIKCSADLVKRKHVNSGFVWVKCLSDVSAGYVFYDCEGCRQYCAYPDTFIEMKYVCCTICPISLVYSPIYCRPNYMTLFTQNCKCIYWRTNITVSSANHIWWSAKCLLQYPNIFMFKANLYTNIKKKYRKYKLCNTVFFLLRCIISMLMHYLKILQTKSALRLFQKNRLFTHLLWFH